MTCRNLTFGVGAHSVVRIKSAMGRGGLVDNITFEDIVAEGVDNVVSVQMGYKPGPSVLHAGRSTGVRSTRAAPRGLLHRRVADLFLY